MSTNVAIEGQQAADGQNYMMWLVFGTLLGIFGPLFAHVMAPVVPTDVLAKGPTEPAQQQIFIGAYVGHAKNHRVKYAWIGFGLSFVLYTSACVACGLLGALSTMPS